VTFFASLVLIFVLLIRPQEIWPVLNALHLLDVFTGLVLIGLVYEIATGRQKNLYAPQLPFLLTFVLWCYFATAAALGASRGFAIGTSTALIPAIFTLAVMFGASTLRKLKATIWLLLVLGAFVAGVAVHQGMTTPECIQRVADEEGVLEPDLSTADGRECGMAMDCKDDTRPDAEWACERLGMFGTYSAGRRVRWRGQLGDPNELSVFIGAVIPLLFAVGLPFRSAASQRSDGRQRWLAILAFGVIALGLYAVILSQSRGGQLVVATVFGIYFVSRFGWKGVVVGIIFALPVILLGGRSDAEADESSTERLELLYEGVSLFIGHPLRGVGVEQFPDQVASPLHLTAHNSYLLAAAETGLPGFYLWSSIVYTSFKIPIAALRHPETRADLRAMAMAIVVSFAGIAVGIFFLSFTYKQLLFVWFGLAAAFYRILREEHPDVDQLKVTFGFRDAVVVAGANVAMLTLLYFYTRMRAGGGG
jgi:hypothetical protein